MKNALVFDRTPLVAVVARANRLVCGAAVLLCVSAYLAVWMRWFFALRVSVLLLMLACASC
jgi:hypothetical protein